MILTGKCKEKFLEWLDEESTWFQTFSDTHQNALIIEFFDSVGIYVNIVRLGGVWNYSFWFNHNRFLEYNFNTRQEATIQAIKKANEIYNERFK